MLHNFLIPEINRRGINQQTMYFQQDRATAHTARASMAVVREIFPGHVTSQCGDLPWPAQSPDLSVCDYFLWGYIKVKVFINKPRTVHELKVAIEHEIVAIPPRHGKTLNEQLQDEAARMRTK
jgi:YD repeat-containing protein